MDVCIGLPLLEWIVERRMAYADIVMELKVCQTEKKISQSAEDDFSGTLVWVDWSRVPAERRNPSQEHLEMILLCEYTKV